MRKCFCGKAVGGQFVTVVGNPVHIECFFDGSIPDPSEIEGSREERMSKRRELMDKRTREIIEKHYS